MKQIIILFKITMLALIVMLSSCENKTYQSYLTNQQNHLLATPGTGTTITFNENGQLITMKVDTVHKELYRQDYKKGGQFSPSSTYNGEMGKVFYHLPNGYRKLFIQAYSKNLYRSIDTPRQTVSIYNSNSSNSNRCDLDFSNKLALKEIGGITYTNVVLGVDSYTQDTLYWKKDLGILGWKKKNENYTVYRVF